MKAFYQSLLACAMSMISVLAIQAQVVINEVDADTDGTDVLEFVELFGAPGTSLDGHILVRYNGSDDASYEDAIDLSGNVLDENGFFVIGNEMVPNVGIVIPSNGLQNGADAVAIYQADAANFPNDTPITMMGLVDAVVYGTSDGDDAELLVLLADGEMQLDESSNGNQAFESSARVPDGGAAFITSTYVQQVPTPGASNVLLCSGGSLSTDLGTDITVCNDGGDTEVVVPVSTTGITDGDATYVYVITDENNIIIGVSAISEVTVDIQQDGVCRIWGLSYTGTLDPTTAEVGDDATMAMTDGECLSLSSNFIQVTKLACDSQCDGGMVDTAEGTEITLCLDGDNTAFDVTTTGLSNETANYLYVITDEANIILGSSESATIDLAGAPEGVCRVWGLSYTGTLDPTTTEVGDDATMVVTDGVCLDLSDNFIQVTREVCNTCDGGSVALMDETTEAVVCLDEEADLLMFNNTSVTTEANYNYVITDESNIIIAVLGAGVAEFDFNTAEEGICRVWGLSYTGNIDATTVEAGDDATMVMTDGDCLQLSSNFITVDRQICVPSEGCDELFFSEYIEGSGNNKALEIYNPTDAPIDLSLYQLVNCGNGCDTPGEWDFTNPIFEGLTIMANDVIVVAHPEADAAILAVADVTFQFLSNGDDVFALQLIGSDEIIDIIGAQGEDPGDGWEVNGVELGTRDHTLVRQTAITAGNADWTTANLEWDVFAQNDFSFIGSHTSECGGSTGGDIPQVGFVGSSASVDESALDICVAIAITDAIYGSTFNFMVSGTAENGTDYNFEFPTEISFEASEEDELLEFCIPLIDDLDVEADETIVLTISNITDDIEINIDTFTITILDNDGTIPTYNIGDVTTLNEVGVVDSLDVECNIEGVVYGVNLRPGGLQFTMIDSTGGIGLFNFEGDFGYTVAEGDLISVTGTIGQFNGLTQIAPDTVMFMSADNPLIDPTVVTELNEFSESNLVKIDCVSLVDPGQWSNSGSGFNVDITDGINTYAMRIDNDVNLYGTDAPVGSFSVTGLGGQFDSSEPFDEGYQLLPRYIEDLADFVVADAALDLEDIGEDLFVEIDENGVPCITPLFVVAPVGYEFQFVPTDSTFASYEWELLGQTVSGFFGLFDVLDLDLPSGASYHEVTLTVTDENGCSDSATFPICFDIIGSVGSESSVEFALYPNPANDQITIQSDEELEAITIYSLDGKVVLAENLRSGNQAMVQLEGVATGTYIVELQTASGISRKTLVKQ